MIVTLHAACSPGEVRVAAWDGRSLLDYAIWRPGWPDGVGDLHRGRVVARIPAMAGAFVALAHSSPGIADGFLPDSAGGGDVHEGDCIVVRVVRAAQGGKGPRLTARIDHAPPDLKTDGPVALLRRGPSSVERLADAYPGADVEIDDAGFAARLHGPLGGRMRVVRHAFADDRLASAVAELSEPAVELPGGARLHVYPTPALVAIDVDLGAATAVRQSKAAAQLAANVALIPDLARQIRLRNLSGAILVDFAGLPVKRRSSLEGPLAGALSADPIAPRLLGFTRLGLAEILRSRIHPPLHELLAGSHAAALRALRLLASAVAQSPGRPSRIEVAPEIAAALESDAVARDDFARRTGHPLAWAVVPGLPPPGWRIRDPQVD